MTAIENVALYHSIARSMRPGDVILLEAVRNPLATIIRAVQGSPISHCGCISQAIHPQDPNAQDVVMGECTIHNGVSGAQRHSLLEVLQTRYPDGRAWLGRLSDRNRARLDLARFYEFLGDAECTVKYGVVNLFEYLLRTIPILGMRIFQSEDKHRMVCDSFVIAWLQYAGERNGLLQGVNYQLETPQQLAEARIYSGPAVQIWGEPKEIPKFNTI
jgi:hypothetical protein